MAQETAAPPATGEQRLKMSYEEYLNWSGEDVHAEWVDGEVLVFMPPKIIHQLILGFLASLLNYYSSLFDLGVVIVAPAEMRARPNGPAREPDLMFVARDHLDRLTPDRLAGPADLVVEVVSDDSVHRDRVDKFYEYQEAGIREYWIIDPRPGKQRVDCYWLMPQGRFQAILPDSEGRYASQVIPDLWFRAEWFWQDPLPTVPEVLTEITRSGG